MRTSGLLTADPDVGADLTDLFNVLTGYSRQTEYRTLLVAPHRHARQHRRADRRRGEAARAGKPCGIRLKANALVDEEVIDALYRASRDGVPIECLIRGICALRPGVSGPVRDGHGPLDPRPLSSSTAGSSISKAPANGGSAAPT